MGIVGQLLQWEGGGGDLCSIMGQLFRGVGVISIALWVSCSWGGGGGVISLSIYIYGHYGSVVSMGVISTYGHYCYWVRCSNGGNIHSSVYMYGYYGSVVPVGVISMYSHYGVR